MLMIVLFFFATRVRKSSSKILASRDAPPSRYKNFSKMTFESLVIPFVVCQISKSLLKDFHFLVQHPWFNCNIYARRMAVFWPVFSAKRFSWKINFLVHSGESATSSCVYDLTVRRFLHRRENRTQQYRRLSKCFYNGNYWFMYPSAMSRRFLKGDWLKL